MLHDPTVASIEDRSAACLVLLYAQPVIKVVALTTDDICSPAERAGHHQHPKSLMGRLNRLGILTRAGRNTAMLHLASTVPPAVFASLVGIDIGTATAGRSAPAAPGRRPMSPRAGSFRSESVANRPFHDRGLPDTKLAQSCRDRGALVVLPSVPHQEAAGAVDQMDDIASVRRSQDV